jgi:hypothetical protein
MEESDYFAEFDRTLQVEETRPLQVENNKLFKALEKREHKARISRSVLGSASKKADRDSEIISQTKQLVNIAY